jgi:transcriptional regulator GlxA family with amidase domain
VQDAATVEWIRRMDARARRTAGVCSGAFLLARAGLLDGRRATTHWRNCAELARRFPRVTVEPDRIYVRDGRISTSAGVTAGMDLALALVEDDLGGELARDVARQLVLFLRRPGGQSQFSVALDAPLASRPSLRDLQTWIHAHPDADLGVEALARRMAMSPRNFARVFTRELATTPARYVERARVEAARQWLEDSRAGVDEVAGACGFGSAETLRRAFQRLLGVSPSAYRETFARAIDQEKEKRA